MGRVQFNDCTVCYGRIEGISAGKLYLSPIMDIHNREIVGFDISDTPNLFQICRMLDMAFEKFDNLEGLIFHSDQGWQYQHFSYHINFQH